MSSWRRATAAALFLTSSLCLSGYAMAQDVPPEEATTLEELVVTGEIVYRNRTETVAPELVYDTEFFQKFEPVSVGDQLKRVPGVSFASDVGEYDSPHLRGLGNGFTQVLVNGRPIPGAGNDRTVFVDRIPAEIVDRIEIVRSPSADIDSQGVGGTINIILKDGASLPPGVVARAGVTYSTDHEEWFPSGALSVSGRNEAETVLFSATVDAQRRFNQKDGVNEVFDDDVVGFDSSSDGRDLFSPLNRSQSRAVEREEQSDRRESTDISFNGDLTLRFAPQTSLRFDGFFIHTDRDDREDTQVFEGDGTIGGVDYSDPELEAQLTTIKQQNFGISAQFDHRFNDDHAFEANVRFSQFNDDLLELGFVEGDDGAVDFSVEDERVEQHADDKEFSADAAIKSKWPQLAQSLNMTSVGTKFGVQGRVKSRDFEGSIASIDDEPAAFGYRENRLDFFGIAEWQFVPSVKLETGVRVETTSTEQTLLGGPTSEEDVTHVNPSAHIQWNVTGADQVRFSVARTVRRPNLEQVTPIQVTDKPEDDDLTRGNPDLQFETSWGVDAGYERRLPGRGVFGINFFYRKVDNLIGLVRVPGEVAPGGGGVYTFDNTGEGKVWGVEFDLSSPLDFIGLPDTGVFANFTRLWSERTEPTTGLEARFDEQPEYIYNFGVTHTIPQWDVSLGFSYQKQGLSEAVFLGEFEQSRYDGNLEVFVEKRFGDHFVLRLSGNNLLDAAVHQNERNYDGDTGQEIIDNQIADNVDEFELEREESSPTVLLTLRAVF